MCSSYSFETKCIFIYIFTNSATDIFTLNIVFFNHFFNTFNSFPKLLTPPLPPPPPNTAVSVMHVLCIVSYMDMSLWVRLPVH